MSNIKKETIVENLNGVMRIAIVQSVEAKVNQRQGLLLRDIISRGPDYLRYAQQYINSLSGIASSDAQYYVREQRAKLGLLKTQPGKKHSKLVPSTDKLATKANGSVVAKMLLRYDPTQTKKPLFSKLGQWVGIEIECFIPYESLACEASECEYCDGTGERENTQDETYECSECEGTGVSNQRPNSTARETLNNLIKTNRIPMVTAKSDGSINCSRDYFPVEFTVLITQDDKSPLEKLCKLLAELGAKVNKSCGLHVHLDQRDLSNVSELLSNPRTAKYLESNPMSYIEFNKRSITTRANRIGRVLPLLFSMVPNSRRTNTYCRNEVGDYGGDRYVAVNKASLEKFGTLEIRMHSATTNFSKISNWIDLLMIISRDISSTGADLTSLEQLCDEVALPERLMVYVESRVATFCAEPMTSTGDSEDTDTATNANAN